MEIQKLMTFVIANVIVCSLEAFKVKSAKEQGISRYKFWTKEPLSNLGTQIIQWESELSCIVKALHQ